MQEIPKWNKKLSFEVNFYKETYKDYDGVQKLFLRSLVIEYSTKLINRRFH